MCTCVTVDYQIVDSNIANQIHGFTIDYGKFILKTIIKRCFVGTHIRAIRFAVITILWLGSKNLNVLLISFYK